MIVESKKLIDGTTVVNDALTAPKTEEDKANDEESVKNPVKVEKDDKKDEKKADEKKADDKKADEKKDAKKDAAPADGAKKEEKKEGAAA